MRTTRCIRGGWRRFPSASSPAAQRRAAPDQKDEDSLPPYEVLDALLRQYLEHNASPAQLEAAGYAPEVVAKTAPAAPE